jgi:uncharacterized protein (DUF983 family)
MGRGVGSGKIFMATDVTTSEAVQRGMRGLCPACNAGRMFRSYLKVADQCPACGEDLSHQRADDFPAYLVIVIVGHIVVPLVLAVETRFAPEYWVHMLLWPVVVIGLTLLMLQPVKGAIVALQWAVGMDGFGASKQQRVLKADPAPAAD